MQWLDPNPLAVYGLQGWHSTIEDVPCTAPEHPQTIMFTPGPSAPPSATPTLDGNHPDELIERTFAEVGDAGIDPRLGHLPPGSQQDIDGGLARQLNHLVHHYNVQHSQQDSDLEKYNAFGLEKPVYVDFAEGDKRNPTNFSTTRKWLITSAACTFTLICSASSATYSMGVTSMARDLNCTTFQANIGVSTFPLGFALVPLVTASFSEEFGRQPLYLGSISLFALFHVMVALAPNIQTVIVGRLFAGAVGSTGSTMVGGTIADLFPPAQRGPPMSIFAVTAIAGTGIGPVLAGWVEQNPHLEWRWIQWLQAIVSGVCLVMIVVMMKETRSTVILTRLVKRIRKETGNPIYRARVEDERASLRTLIYISCTRPLYLLFTEPLVSSFSIWVGFLWGILYCMISSIGPVFKTLHRFDAGQGGTAFASTIIGTLLGYATNFYQESLYRKNHDRKGPEARLYLACAAAVVFPIAMLIYAWTSYPWVHWIAMEVGITLFMWATFVIYLCVFTYLADCYGQYASSALAGQSLFRNLMATAFPLFTAQMFARLTYKWANTLFACIGVLLIPLPFILFSYGPKIRARSKFSSAVMQGKSV